MKSAALLAVALIAFGGAPMIAAVVNLSPSQDTGLFDFSPGNNFGAAPNNIVGATANANVGRVLIEFDIAGAIPADATINSVTLRLVDVSSPAGIFVPSTFSLHRALVDWNGGTNVGNAAASGSATWDYRVSETINWGNPGGASGTDYAAAASAGILLSQLSATNSPGTNFWGSTPGLVADVQDWLNNPGTNLGWFVLSSGELTARTARRFGTVESTAAGTRPLLTIDFTPVPEPATVSLTISAVLGALLWRRRRQS